MKEAKKKGISLDPKGVLPKVGPFPHVPTGGRLKVIYMSSKFRNHGLSHLVSSMFKAIRVRVRVRVRVRTRFFNVQVNSSSHSYR